MNDKSEFPYQIQILLESDPKLQTLKIFFSITSFGNDIKLQAHKLKSHSYTKKIFQNVPVVMLKILI